jgi:predicted nucleic acid-binding protein
MTSPRAVFDSVILLQAVTNPNGPSWAALALADTGRIRIVASDATLKEAEGFRPSFGPEAVRDTR